MNRKGENTMAGVGTFMGIFVLVIVGIALFSASAQNVGEASDLLTIANRSLTGVAVSGTSQFFTDIKLISDVKVFNATGDVEIPADNYTIVNNVVNEGALAVSITPATPAPELGYDDGTWTIDGTAQPLGYIPEGGARSIAGLIAVFFALAIAIVALEPTLRSGVLNMVGR